MPQLNPAPWFALLVFSWATFMIFLPPKVLTHNFPNEPAMMAVQSTEKTTWTWKW
uniref:ATP synthase complex subunit 8 n=1 Tax=Acanthemblemaria sp. AC-2023 TaxID=3028466 RepID=A0AA51ZUU4_9TELE|nr:ATP synthase F0 subunit 8 [Acanthemblemaria sp. AC-2023]